MYEYTFWFTFHTNYKLKTAKVKPLRVVTLAMGDSKLQMNGAVEQQLLKLISRYQRSVTWYCGQTVSLQTTHFVRYPNEFPSSLYTAHGSSSAIHRLPCIDVLTSMTFFMRRSLSYRVQYPPSQPRLPVRSATLVYFRRSGVRQRRWPRDTG